MSRLNLSLSLSRIVSYLLLTFMELVMSTSGCTKNSLLCYNRKAILSGPVSKEEANGILVSVARFINSCVVEQIHLAPEKCMSLHFRFFFPSEYSGFRSKLY